MLKPFQFFITTSTVTKYYKNDSLRVRVFLFPLNSTEPHFGLTYLIADSYRYAIKRILRSFYDHGKTEECS